MSVPGGMYYLTRRPFACFLVCFEFAMLLVHIFFSASGWQCLPEHYSGMGGDRRGRERERDLLLNSYIKMGNCKQGILLCTFIKY